MDLTLENKAYIDGLNYYGLLRKWRFAPVGDPWFQGETGEYWAKRLGQLRDDNPENTVQVSKELVWEKQ